MSMSFLETVKLLQFRAAYNLPIHAGVETAIFSHHGLALEVAYTPSSSYLIQGLKEGRFEIGHTAADDVIADIGSDASSDLFLFMGLHTGLFSLIAGSECSSVESLLGKPIGVDSKNSGFALVLESMLLARGLARDDYQLIEIGGWEGRYQALMDKKITATLLTEPFITSALQAGCQLLARDFEMIPSYQGTCGAASRRWAERHPDVLARYIRAYVEATEWCFRSENRGHCLDILARHNSIDRSTAELTLDALLHPAHGLYRKAALNVSGVAAALDLRADLGYLARPVPPTERFIDLSYYREALSVGAR
jgi:ABC-type nitrate/sulfonate/bicarbonate transport system substrate-binding protein